MTFPQAGPCQVKICGLTTQAQCLQVAALGADALGLNFWPKSKRYLDPQIAAPWLPTIRQHVALVAVLVNASVDLLKQAAELVDVLQLHGDETPADCANAMKLGLPVIKAFQVKDAASLGIIRDYPCRDILLDAYCPGNYGGEGKTFPWALAIAAQRLYPERRIILAGGLTTANVGEAVRGVQPCAVDVASGVELAPGDKDLTLCQQFIDAVRSARRA